MAKSSGLGAGLFVSGYDLSGDTADLSRIGGGPNLLPITGINKSAMERIGGVRDGEINVTSWFNDASNQEHTVYSSLPTADRLVTYAHRTAAIGDSAFSTLAKQINYDATRGQDGSLSFNVQALANGYGLEAGLALTAGKRTDSGATNGSSHDYGATIGQTTLGAQAHLHVFAFTGTDATITIQDSTDDSSWATLASFAQVTSGPTSERIATSATETVDRYVRVITTTTGGFSDLQFAVYFTKNQTSTVF